MIPHATSVFFMVFLRPLFWPWLHLLQEGIAVVSPQYSGSDFTALNAFHRSCFSQGPTDEQTDMQSR